MGEPRNLDRLPKLKAARRKGSTGCGSSDGCCLRPGSLTTQPASFDSTWDRVLDLNVKGVFHLTKFLLPLLKAAGTADDPARVINVGSIDGIHVPILETYSYSSSKAAVHQLTRHLARQLGRQHITVNAIAPGPFESKMMAETLRNFGDSIAASSPLGRIGRPEEIARWIGHLVDEKAEWVTGAVITVDGGRVLGPPGV